MIEVDEFRTDKGRVIVLKGDLSGPTLFSAFVELARRHCDEVKIDFLGSLKLLVSQLENQKEMN